MLSQIESDCQRLDSLMQQYHIVREDGQLQAGPLKLQDLAFDDSETTLATHDPNKIEKLSDANLEEFLKEDHIGEALKKKKSEEEEEEEKGDTLTPMSQKDEELLAYI